MPRIRTVKPEFWEDEKIACLSRDARLMLIGCFNLADDEGLLRWTPAYIKSGLFMYDDDLDIDGVKALMAEVTGARIVLTYSPAVKGAAKQQLAWIVKFRIHQKINRPQPSKLSPPSLQNRSVQDAYAERDSRVCHLCGGPVNEIAYIDADPYSPVPPLGWACLNASLDHIKPRTKGGGDHPTNVALSHVGCNKGRRERPISEFSVPASVRSALNSIGWISDLDVNDSRNHSVNHSVNEDVSYSPPDREGEEEREGDQGTEEPPYPPDDEPSPPRPLDRQTGVGKALATFEAIPGQPSSLARRISLAYDDRLQARMSPKLLKGVAEQIDICLCAGNRPDEIALGLQAWTESKSFAASQIPAFVHKANNGHTVGNGVSKPTISALDHQAAGEALLAKVSTK